ncbi:D-alanyl-D-alanine carboxypeptidase family protein [Protaetiibacter intestinalis]|uniref:D-alanyl-D-alanine carboxypeptidase n=1 Tax=Protaetiibacter intestinalis TaxID=2419774 RepID=A0A387BBF9_9MICO|nr:D-alanyl-D-alanine carboxypeptidase [Protaetiibacter intestinalis]AYF99028.1 D-alanyl-D-alanine carboxypeptidase [Protaetiibacter intestinalis]
MPLTRRQVYRRRRIAVFGGTLVLLAGLSYLPLTLLAPVAELEPAVTTPEVAPGTAVQLAMPAGAASAISAVGREGTLAQAGSADALPMASITKIITALTVLDAHPLGADEVGPSVTMTAADVALYRRLDSGGASVAPVKSGVVYTERELLEIMLIDSAGNYAITIGNWAFGSQDALVAAMRSWLDAHGFPGINVVEPTGQDARNTATAADLVRLGEAALANPALAQIVAITKIDIHDVGKLENSNKLLGEGGVDGIKTGTLNAFGANLLFSADLTVGDAQIPLVGVVLGAATHAELNAGVRSLLAQVTAGYRVVPLIAAGDAVAEYATPWDTTADAVAASAASLVVWSDTPITATVTAQSIHLADRGTEVGSVTFTAGTQTVTVPLDLAEDVEDPGPGWRLGHPEIIFGMR